MRVRTKFDGGGRAVQRSLVLWVHPVFITSFATTQMKQISKIKRKKFSKHPQKPDSLGNPPDTVAGPSSFQSQPGAHSEGEQDLMTATDGSS